MRNEPLPDEHHVARYCKPSSVEDGLPSAEAFTLKQDEEYLSVNWLEYFNAPDLTAAVERVREAFRNKSYQVRRNARFAVLNVEAAKRAVHKATESMPAIKHLPTRDDPSHTGIFGGTAENFAIAVQLAALITLGNMHAAVLDETGTRSE